MSTIYDIVVIGGGPGGYPAAIRAAQKGLKVACIEKRGSLGGTCLNVGCIPSKAMLHSSHEFSSAQKNFKKLGLMGGDKVTVDFDKVQKNKEATVKGLTSGIEFLFKKNKVSYLKGFGSITADGEVQLTKPDGSTDVVKTSNIILATGSEPSNLPGQGLPIDEKSIVTSTGALALDKIPKKMIVIGGGVIGLELGCVYKRFGSEVQVVEFLDHICPSLDRDVGKEFQKILTKQGIKFSLGHKVLDAKKVSDGVEVTVENLKDNTVSTLKADVVLVAVGRRPVTSGLNLDRVGLSTDKLGRIEVDDRLHAGKVGVTDVWAIGDCTVGPMLAHKAEEEGVILAEGIATKHFHKLDHNHIPQVVYTHPEVAGVGESEEQLKKRGKAYKAAKFPLMANSRARCTGDADGYVKLLYCPDNHFLLGGWIVGDKAGELIHELTVIMNKKGSVKDISSAVHAHPTLSEAVKEAAMMAVDGKAIHFA
eukprot:GHVH01011054.1.p1 GENE.GHVH01011054.1~~GHVH01011054.1.p1  ORF type:complete len:478 (+),score=89.43 GHVH01011054.1:87-1520(+)